MTRDGYIRYRNRQSDRMGSVHNATAQALGRAMSSGLPASAYIGKFQIHPLANVPFSRHQ